MSDCKGAENEVTMPTAEFRNPHIRNLRLLGLSVCSLAAFAGAISPQPVLAQAGSATYTPTASEMRLWRLIERDRPRNLLEGNRYDSKDSRRMEKVIKREAALIVPAAAEYRRTRSASARRKLLEIVNRGGMRWDDWGSSGILLEAFRALHEAGQPLNDPEDGNDAEFGAKRHRALLRFFAEALWRDTRWNDQLRRTLAGYMSDCERRPSNSRPSGNSHDPSCGFIFEVTYGDGQISNGAWDPSKVQQSMAEYAAGVHPNRATPQLEGRLNYPLVPNGPLPAADELWAGNRAKLAAVYARQYFASREYFERRAAEGAIANAAERKRANDLIAYRNSLIPRWEALWARTNLSPAEQLDLENISESIYRFDVYRTRYNIISFDRLERYCQLGFAYECSRKYAIEAAGREQRRQAEGNWGAAPANQSVTVRSYDRNGNYTGSTTTTRIDAELMGAR